MLQINLKNIHNVPEDVKQLLDAHSAVCNLFYVLFGIYDNFTSQVEDIFIRTIALGHSPVLLANIISASTTQPTKKKKQQPTKSIFTSPKILDTYLSVCTTISQSLTSNGGESSETSELGWPPVNSQAALAFALEMLSSLAVGLSVQTRL